MNTQANPTPPSERGRGNRTIPRAIAKIREITGTDDRTATTLAVALDEAGILANPRRNSLIVLRRTSGGQWTDEPRTELEAQALAWDAALGRAARLAEQIRTEMGGEHAVGTGLLDVRTSRERVLVSAQITSVAQWAGWCRYLGITEEEPGSPEYAYIGSGHRGGVGVSVVAYDAPQTEARTVAAATMPFRYGGGVFDLALPLRDQKGGIWDYRQLRTDGMPLLSRRDDPTYARCSLARVVEFVGPLTAVRDEVPVSAAGGAA
ncbi:BN159_2729 family protein [Streptomyces odonnellii]|uniref:BN159_2729 family protein n=1 Tax=Streptomyces odonnellii TaxID=1417980 RepID=UPI0006969942|nr:BN159_2729 family protein [Streptomyces odonnellii]